MKLNDFNALNGVISCFSFRSWNVNKTWNGWKVNNKKDTWKKRENALQFRPLRKISVSRRNLRLGLLYAGTNLTIFKYLLHWTDSLGVRCCDFLNCSIKTRKAYRTAIFPAISIPRSRILFYHAYVHVSPSELPWTDGRIYAHKHTQTDHQLAIIVYITAYSRHYPCSKDDITSAPPRKIQIGTLLSHNSNWSLLINAEELVNLEYQQYVKSQ